MRKQVPGKRYTFICQQTGEKDSGVLPATLGESNSFVRWQPHRNTWVSRKLGQSSSRRSKRGLGPQGLVCRMRALLWALKNKAKIKGFALPLISAEEMVEQWNDQAGICVACGEPGLILLDRGSVYDHNHETGEGRGFIHSYCNIAEGYLSNLSSEAFEKYVTWIRKTRSPDDRASKVPATGRRYVLPERAAADEVPRLHTVTRRAKVVS